MKSTPNAFIFNIHTIDNTEINSKFATRKKFKNRVAYFH